MAENKTRATQVDVTGYLSAIEPEAKRRDAERLDALFREVTGFVPKMWGPSMIGYGRYHYRYATGHEGESLATGFAVRGAEFVLYIMPGYADFEPILAQLGKHRKGKSCLYFRRLDGIDEASLRALIAAGLTDLAKHWDVHPD